MVNKLKCKITSKLKLQNMTVTKIQYFHKFCKYFRLTYHPNNEMVAVMRLIVTKVS